MNFVFFSPHFPPQWYLFCVQLARQGVRVLGIADTPYERLRPELQKSLTDYWRVNDLHDYQGLKNACLHFQRKYGKLDRIESHNEYWLETQAALRRDFDIPGLRPEHMAEIKRKSRMKQVFQRAGIATARGVLATSLNEGRALAAQTGYPLVAKPDTGVGAAATYKLRDEGQMRQFFASKPPTQYFLEEYVQGDIYTFDGLVDRQGQLVFHGGLTYSRGVMEVVNEDAHMYYYTLREIPADLEEVGRRTLQAFGVRESFFHFEYFRTPDGRLVALEVNMRPPGGPTTDMYNWSCDIDLYRAWAEVIATGKSTLRYERKYWCNFISRKDRLRYKHGHEEVLRKIRPHLIHHRPMEPAFARAMGNYAYVVRAPELQAVLEDAHYAHQLA